MADSLMKNAVRTTTLLGWWEDSAGDGGGHRGGPVADAELVEDPHHVALHGGLADVERAPDVRIGQSTCDTAEDFGLARGECGAAADPAEQLGRDRRRQHGLPACGG